MAPARDIRDSLATCFSYICGQVQILENERVHFRNSGMRGLRNFVLMWETLSTFSCSNRSPAEPTYTLKKQTDLDLHFLPLSMQIYISNLDQVIWLAEN